MTVKDMVGKRIGRLVVTSRANNIEDCAAWHCQCDCGNMVVIRGHSLRRELSKSCGCFRREEAARKFTTHGARVGRGTSPEYQSYLRMKDRCLSPNHHQYKDYGGRGVTICDRWLSGFENFLADMGTRPTLKHTLDRRDNDGNYCPENCRWATRKEQARNSRVNRPLQRSDGAKFLSYGHAAEVNGGSYSSIRRACISGKPYRGFGWRYI